MPTRPALAQDASARRRTAKQGLAPGPHVGRRSATEKTRHLLDVAALSPRALPRSGRGCLPQDLSKNAARPPWRPRGTRRKRSESTERRENPCCRRRARRHPDHHSLTMATARCADSDTDRLTYDSVTAVQLKLGGWEGYGGHRDTASSVAERRSKMCASVRTDGCERSESLDIYTYLCGAAIHFGSDLPQDVTV